MQFYNTTAVVHQNKLYAFSYEQRVIRYSLSNEGFIESLPLDKSEARWAELKGETARGLWYDGKYHLLVERECCWNTVLDYAFDHNLSKVHSRALIGMEHTHLWQCAFDVLRRQRQIIVVDSERENVRVFTFDDPCAQDTISLPPRGSYVSQKTQTQLGCCSATQAVVSANERYLLYLSNAQIDCAQWGTQPVYVCHLKQSCWYCIYVPCRGVDSGIQSICLRGGAEKCSKVLLSGWIRALSKVTNNNKSMLLCQDLIDYVSIWFKISMDEEVLHILCNCGYHYSIQVAKLISKLNIK